MKRLLFTPFVAALVLSNLNANAETTRDFYQAYKQGNYKQAVKIARRNLIRTPGNVNLRYYLADSYSRLGNKTAAIEQLQLCIKHGGRTNVAVLARKRIETLTGDKSKNKNFAHLEKQIETRRKEILKELEAKKKVAAGKFDLRVKKIQQDQSLSESARERRLTRAFEDYKKEEQELTDTFQRRADQLASQKENVSRAAGSKGSVRVVPKLSDLRTRNYENLGNQSDLEDIPDEQPLKAKQNRLKLKGPEQGKP